MKRERGIAVSLAVSLLLTGCATVEPRSDYVRVTERVQQATGMGEMYLPGEEERIAASSDRSAASVRTGICHNSAMF